MTSKGYLYKICSIAIDSCMLGMMYSKFSHKSDNKAGSIGQEEKYKSCFRCINHNLSGSLLLVFECRFVCPF